MKEHTLAAQPTREQQWVSANNMQVRAKGLSESLMNSHRGAKRKAVLPKNIQPCFILRLRNCPHVSRIPNPPLTLSLIPERAWRFRPQRLLGEDRERKVVQRGLAVRVQEIGQVAVAPAVPLDQGVLVLPPLVWVYLIWRYVSYVAIFFIIDVSVTVIEVQLFSIFVLNGHVHKVLQ